MTGDHLGLAAVITCLTATAAGYWITHRKKNR